MLMHSKSPLWLIRTLVGLVSRLIFFNSFQVAGRNKETFTLVARKILGVGNWLIHPLSWIKIHSLWFLHCMQEKSYKDLIIFDTIFRIYRIYISSFKNNQQIKLTVLLMKSLEVKIRSWPLEFSICMDNLSVS